MAALEPHAHQTDALEIAGSEVLETSAPGQVVDSATASGATVTPLSREPAGLEQRGANLHPEAATRHGIGPLTTRGELPAGSEFDLFRGELEARRREALAWVGGDDANVFDRDEAEASARWSTASDLVWGVLFAEGIFSRTRRRKSLVELAERIDKRASYHRELCRARRRVKDVGSMSIQEWITQAQQPHTQKQEQER